MSDLHDDLTDIQGVGDATADKLLDLLDKHGQDVSDAYIEKAIDAAIAGNDRDAANVKLGAV